MKTVNKRIRASLILLCFTCLTIQATTIDQEWTWLAYVQSRNNLNRFAIKNFSDMASIGSNKNIQMLIQWYQPNEPGIWRYRVVKNKLELDGVITNNTDGNQIEDLVGAMQWAKTNYEAKQYALVLWNHGVGILDPVWQSNGKLSFQSRDFYDTPRIQIEGITTPEGEPIPLKNGMALDEFCERGILFNEQARTYMKNEDLVESLRQIKTDVLGGKKIDLLGMDACLMAMLEIAYQSKEFAQYFVASQEVELAYGWNYLALMSLMSETQLTPTELAKSIVLTFETYYKNRIPFYTQSAINLAAVDMVKDNLNEIVTDMLACLSHDQKTMKQIILNTRRSCVQFSTRNYIDLYSFYENFIYRLNNDYINKPPRKNKHTKKEDVETKNNILITQMKALQSKLEIGMQLIKNAVIANVAGPNVRDAKGLSIYFPYGGIDKSYRKTVFAKDTLWVDFLEKAF